MRIAHLSDLHLGFRAYHRLSPGGLNARERDVAQSFRSALGRVIELEPDLILIAGDVFHSVRPSNAAIADAFRQFMRLHAALPDTPVVIIAGDHDSPRSVETGSILRLFAEIPGFAVADDQARTVYLPTINTSVLCVPRNALMSTERIALEPDEHAHTNVLMMHGTITDVEDDVRYLHDYGGPEIDSRDIRSERWDYVALGHFHKMREIKPNMWYSGAIERTSRNIWQEQEEKGFVLYDTQTRTGTPQPLVTRPVVDLPAFSARVRAYNDDGAPVYMSGADLNARIQSLVESIPGGYEGKIVRLVIYDVPRELFREIDHRLIREYKASALHFHIDARRPEIVRTGPRALQGRGRTLDEEVAEFIGEHWNPSSAEIDRARLVELASRYLEDAARDVESEP